MKPDKDGKNKKSPVQQPPPGRDPSQLEKTEKVKHTEQKEPNPSGNKDNKPEEQSAG